MTDVDAAPGEPSGPVLTAAAPARGGPGGSDLVRFARGGAINLAGGAANGIFTFLLVVVMTRGLGAAGTGAFFEAAALFQILAAACLFGADTGVVRTIPPLLVGGRGDEVRALLRVALRPAVAVSALAAVVAYVAAPSFVAVFMHEVPVDDGVRYVRLMVPWIPFATATAIVLAATRGFGTMVPTASIENVAKPLLRVIFAIVAIATGAEVVGVTVAWTVPVGLGFVAAVLALRSTEHRHVASGAPSDIEPVPTSGAAFWRFSFPRGVAGIFEISLGWFDILLLGAFLPAEQVGIYAAVSRTAVMFLFVLRASSYALAPRISALLATRRIHDAQDLYQVATRWLILLAWPIYLLLAVFAPFLLGVFGPGFVAGAQAMSILAVAMVFNMATGNVNAVLLMGGKSSWNLLNAGVALGLNVVLNLALIPSMGIEGAAIAWATSIIVMNVMAVLEVKLLLGVDPFGRGYLQVAGSAALAFGVLGFVIVRTVGANARGFGLAVVAGGISYAALLYRERRWLGLEALRGVLAGTSEG